MEIQYMQTTPCLQATDNYHYLANFNNQPGSTCSLGMRLVCAPIQDANYILLARTPALSIRRMPHWSVRTLVDGPNHTHPQKSTIFNETVLRWVYYIDARPCTELHWVCNKWKYPVLTKFSFSFCDQTQECSTRNTGVYPKVALCSNRHWSTSNANAIQGLVPYCELSLCHPPEGYMPWQTKKGIYILYTRQISKDGPMGWWVGPRQGPVTHWN